MTEVLSSQRTAALGTVRKPYRKPEVLSRERLEALAVVCSPPSKADVIACPNGQITS